MAKVLLYDDPLFEQHDTGSHPEKAERLRGIRAALTQEKLAEQCTAIETKPAARDDLLRIHGPNYIDRVKQTASSGGGRLDPDTVVSSKSFDVAVQAAGTAIDAVDRVIAGDANRALCLVRPPGHHCLPNRAMGFCLFANVSLAAAHARAKHDLDHVLIVDWDVHHGNGTQDIFYDDGQVHFFSAHRSPFYPGTGDENETGTGAGLGATTNLPLRFGISRKKYIDAFTSKLESAVKACQPDLILLSAGFDAHAADPIGSLGLESEDFATLTEIVCDAAQQHCDGKLVSLLEGGYNIEKLGESVAAHLRVLLEYGDDE